MAKQPSTRQDLFGTEGIGEDRDDATIGTRGHASQGGTADPRTGGRERRPEIARQMDEAHRDAGDGTLQGSVPAGMTSEELREQAETGAPGADTATD